VLPYTIGNYLANKGKAKATLTSAVVKQAVDEATARYQKLIDIGQKGHTSVDTFHRKLGLLIWDHCGMERNAAGLQQALEEIPKLREEFWRDVRITGSGGGLNGELEKAGRVADFFELGELMCRDALERDESAGCHFRSEHQSNGECIRDDERFAHVAAWEWKGKGPDAREGNQVRHAEKLDFEYVKLTQRSYK
jgi:succinate dehydrogenase / fumarate reductase, flavoprotein subunit